jgi:hypothetical protein
VVRDESTEYLDLGAFCMRGAQPGATGYLVSQGYDPSGKCEAQRFDAEGGSIDAVHEFKVRQVADV